MTDLEPPVDNDLRMALNLAWAWRASNMEERVGNQCIQATRIGLEVLGNVEVPASALPCAIVVRNADAVDASLRGLPVADWPPSAWSVGVDPDAPPPPPDPETASSALLGPGKVVDNRRGERGWNGHLILMGNGWLLDLTASQFSRPLRNMELHAWAAPIVALEEDENSWLFARDNGCTIRVYPRPELAAWRNGSAWRQDPPADAITALTHLTLSGPRRSS